MRFFGRLAFVAGMAAPVVYLATVVAGGWATQGYDHLSEPVSALFETGAPHALEISLAFIFYNILILLFGAGFYLASRGHHPAIGLAAGMVVLNGVMGLIIELTPMDPAGTPATAAGIAHIVVAALLVMSSAGAMGLAAIGYWAHERGNKGAMATAMLLVLMLAAGVMAALSASQDGSLLGLYQRLTIGAYLVWLFGLAANLSLRPVSSIRTPVEQVAPVAADG